MLWRGTKAVSHPLGRHLENMPPTIHFNQPQLLSFLRLFLKKLNSCNEVFWDPKPPIKGPDLRAHFVIIMAQKRGPFLKLAHDSLLF